MTSKTRGQCRLCGRTFSKAQMTQHIKSCLAKKGQGDHMLLVVQDLSRLFWVYMTVATSVDLMSFDYMLRDLWVECCDHMSAFSSGSVSYLADPEPSWGMPGRELGMNVRLKTALQTTGTLKYQYDFGSTTELTIRLISVNVAGNHGAMEILARNELPVIPCLECEKPATTLVFKDWEPEPYCEACCGEVEEMALPVINSPRMGVCGYGGPSREP